MLQSFKARSAAFFLLCLCAVPFLPAQTPDTEQMYSILDKFFDSVNSKKDLTCTLSLITEKPNEPKAAYQFKLFRRDKKDQTCLVQLAPEAEKGTGYLQENDNLWTYDPSSHQFTHSSLKRGNRKNAESRCSLCTGKVFYQKRHKLNFKNRKLRLKRKTYAHNTICQIHQNRRPQFAGTSNSHQ